MREGFVKLIQVLDGTPAVYGKRQSGQSVVELALITPILIILLAGLIEIGWFANNYLTLLDVTRAGARRGAVLQDQQSPLFWDNKYSYVPTTNLAAEFQMPINHAVSLPPDSAGNVVIHDNGDDTDRQLYRWSESHPEACDPQYVDRVFYNEVICTMLTTMQPLSMNPSNGIDDIIVTGYALQAVDPAAHPGALAAYPYRPFNNDDPQVVVAGRYPTNANECDVIHSNEVYNSDGTLRSFVPVVGSRTVDDGRDPFDINRNGRRDVAPPDGTDSFTEVEGYDQVEVAGHEADAEKQIGFPLFGNHKIPHTSCVGSEWTVSQVEQLMNLQQFNLDTATRKSYLPSQGLILVEMYWEHEMLLKIPVLSPVFTAVGNQDGKMVIDIWAAFPLSTVEPYIIFS